MAKYVIFHKPDGVWQVLDMLSVMKDVRFDRWPDEVRVMFYAREYRRVRPEPAPF